MLSKVLLTLGPTFAAEADGRRVTFAYRRAERLLAYLALNGPCDRGRVASALWPAVDRERALASLRQALRAVALAGGEGWIVSDRSTLRLHETIVVRRGEGRLLQGWGEPWLPAVPSHEEATPPFDALFSLVAWYRDRAPETALGMVSDAFPVFSAAPPARQVGEVGPIIERLSCLPSESGEVCSLVGRAYYLQGDMEKAHALFGRIATEIPRSVRPEMVANARLSQVVILRESGAVRAAARSAREVVASHPDTPYFNWSARYHLGLSLHLGGDREGLPIARAAVESDGAAGDALTRLFPVLNVAEALIDRNDPAARTFLIEGRRLATIAGDALGLLNVELLEGLRIGGEAPEIALERLRDLERRVWEARLAPFAAGLADRAAVLAHRLGRREEARRLLARGDQVRKRLSLRRVPIESARLAPLRAL